MTGTTIALVRSSGPAPVPVPDLAGLDLTTALRILAAAAEGGATARAVLGLRHQSALPSSSMKLALDSA